MNRATHILWRTGTVLLLLGALAGGVVLWLRWERQQTRAVPILMYHLVAEIADSAWCVPPDVFERQMRALREQGYTSILPRDLAAHRRWGKPLPRHPIVITFDDGYRNALTTAEPILKRHGLRGIVYLITEKVGPVPADRLMFEGHECLTWYEIRALHRRGTLVFGGHSHAHRNLAILDDPLPLIRECFNQIGEYGQYRADSFCYPHGEYNDATVAAVRRVGFTTAMVCEDTVARTGPTMKLLALPRVSVIGGRHTFTATRRPADAGTHDIVYAVTHEGIPLEVTPLLRRHGADSAAIVFPAREIGRETVDWRWTPPEDAREPASYRLEIWDKHRIFKLFEEERKEQPDS